MSDRQADDRRTGDRRTRDRQTGDGDEADPERPRDGADPERSVAVQASDDAALFLSATMQFYRAEVDRVTTWRTRLDQTTNWAVVVMAAILTWVFSSPDNPHYVLLVGALAMASFLLIEAQRYQEYDAWRARVLLLQGNLLASIYRRTGPEREDWRDQLGHDLREPTLRLPVWLAAGHRLHRVYFQLLTVLLAAWALRVSVFEEGAPWQETAAIASVPGPVVVAVVGACYLVLAGVTVWSATRATKREFDHDGTSGTPGEDTSGTPGEDASSSPAEER